MVSTSSLINPKAAALFRVMVTNGGLTSEFIKGGVLRNPLPLSDLKKAITDTVIAVKSELKKITAPTPPALDINEFTKTDGEPKAIVGKELHFVTYNQLITELNLAYQSLQAITAHTDRVVNNLIDLLGLAQSYTQSVQKMGIGLPLKKRIDVSTVPNYHNVSNRRNNINLGGVDGSEAPSVGFNNLDIHDSPIDNHLPQMDDSGSNVFGAQYKDQNTNGNLPITDYRMLDGLDLLLANNGIPSDILPNDALIAEINQGAHCAALFKSIMSAEYGGVVQPIISEFIEKLDIIGTDLADLNTIRTTMADLRINHTSLTKIINDERELWGNDVLQPPTFPSGKVLKTIFQVSRCESVVNMSIEDDVQGILYTCITPLVLEILRTE